MSLSWWFLYSRFTFAWQLKVQREIRCGNYLKIRPQRDEIFNWLDRLNWKCSLTSGYRLTVHGNHNQDKRKQRITLSHLFHVFSTGLLLVLLISCSLFTLFETSAVANAGKATRISIYTLLRPPSLSRQFILEIPRFKFQSLLFFQFLQCLSRRTKQQKVEFCSIYNQSRKNAF